MSDGLPQAKFVHGTDEAADGAADKTVIDPAANKTLRVLKGIVAVTVAAVGGGGLVGLEDGAGGTRIFNADADAVGVHHFDFGPRGYPLTKDNVLNLAVDGAVTTQATARATVVAYEV